jgi:hypothetical protein
MEIISKTFDVKEFATYLEHFHSIKHAPATNPGHFWLDLQEAKECYSAFELLQCSKQRLAPGASLSKSSKKIGSKINNFGFAAHFTFFAEVLRGHPIRRSKR